MRAVVVAASLLVCATTLTAGCATGRDGEAGGGAVELGWHVPGAPDAAGVPDDVRAMAGPFADTMAVV